MNNNPKINLTTEDKETYLIGLFVDMILKKDHPEIIKRARKMAKKFLKENVDK